MFVATNRVVYMVWWTDQNDKTKNSKFHHLRIIGYKNYRVKLYLAY